MVPVRAALIACVCGALLLSITTPKASEKNLFTIELIAKGGAVELALQQLDQYQPSAVDNPEDWFYWEQSRISMMDMPAYWRQARDRLATMPSHLNSRAQRWALVQRANLSLSLKAPTASLRHLRELIWSYGSEVKEIELASWRRMIAQAYLSAGQLDDTRRTINRAEQDYHWKDFNWNLLKIRAYMLNQQPHEALLILEKLPKDKVVSGALRLLALSRTQLISAPIAYRKSVAAAQLTENTNAERAKYWFIAAETSQTLKNWEMYLYSLEQSVQLASTVSGGERLYRITNSDLNESYQHVGGGIANRYHLLVGDEDAWLNKVDKLRPDKPALARSLAATAAHMATKEGRSAEKLKAQDKLADLIMMDEVLDERFLKFYYIDAGDEPDLDEIPRLIRYRLFDLAIVEGDIELASRLSETLESPPKGIEDFDWRLRRARIMVMSAKYDKSIAILDGIFEQLVDARGRQVDKLLQIVFDLQAVLEHDHALEILSKLEHWNLSPKHRREILFWRAESLQAKKQPANAAVLYLRSATLLDGFGGDQWGQAARYHAADALAEAGMVNDARHIYEKLLNESKLPVQRARLRRQIQQLWVKNKLSVSIAKEAKNE